MAAEQDPLRVLKIVNMMSVFSQVKFSTFLRIKELSSSPLWVKVFG